MDKFDNSRFCCLELLIGGNVGTDCNRDEVARFCRDTFGDIE
jgi:hypothetical protein